MTLGTTEPPKSISITQPKAVIKNSRDVDKVDVSVTTSENKIAHANKRVLARVIDVVLVSMIYYALTKITSYETIIPTQMPATTMPATPIPTFSTHNFLILYIASLLIFWLCNIVLIIKNGQTVGKKLTKIKVAAKGNGILNVHIITATLIRELFFYSGITPLFGAICFTFTECSSISLEAIVITDEITSTHVVLDYDKTMTS